MEGLGEYLLGILFLIVIFIIGNSFTTKLTKTIVKLDCKSISQQIIYIEEEITSLKNQKQYLLDTYSSTNKKDVEKIKGKVIDMIHEIEMKINELVKIRSKYQLQLELLSNKYLD